MAEFSTKPLFRGGEPFHLPLTFVIKHAANQRTQMFSNGFQISAVVPLFYPKLDKEQVYAYYCYSAKGTWQ